MVVPLRSQVRLRLSRLSVQHGRSASSHRPALTLARCSVAAHCALLRVLATPALRASDVRKLTRGAPCFTGLIDGYCSHWLRRLFRPHWAYFALLRPQGARFVRPPPLPHPQFAMVAPLRSQARLRPSLAYWAYYGLLPPLAAAFVRPYPFPLKSYGFSGAETARKRFLL